MSGRHRYKAGIILMACLAASAGASEAFAQTPAARTEAASTTPDFSGLWTRAWKRLAFFETPESGPQPVSDDPLAPHGDIYTPLVADLSNPILQPATRARLKMIGEEENAGRPLLKNDSLCLPVGVAAALNLFDPMQVLQTPTEVIFLYARDHQFRIVYLDKPHTAGLKPTWYGESVGHYEGRTLVVDTIGMNDKTLMDRFGTPHSERLHVIERYSMSEGNKTLLATVTFEDSAVFTTPWTGLAHYRREGAPRMEEIVCAENNRPVGKGDAVTAPFATKADF